MVLHSVVGVGTGSVAVILYIVCLAAENVVSIKETANETQEET